MLTLSILYGLQWLRLRMRGESDNPHIAAVLFMDQIEPWVDRLARLLRLDRRTA